MKPKPNSPRSLRLKEETAEGAEGRREGGAGGPLRLPEAPPGMFRITKTELVWPGKYNQDGTLREVPRVSLPFQVIERIGESRATREARKARGPTLFDMWEQDEGETFEEGWRNKLIWGDNLLVMGSLLEQFAGKIDLIYIDPRLPRGRVFHSLPGSETGASKC